MIIQMDDVWLNQVKKRMLYPRRDELVLTDDDLKELCVFPALIEYYNRFPIKTFYTQLIQDQENIFDYPDTETFGLVDCRVVEKNYTMRSSQGGNDFLSLAYYQRTRSGMKATPRYGKYNKSRKLLNFNPEGLRFQYINDRQMRNALTELETFKYTVDDAHRKLFVYTSVPAKVAMTWASYSLDFEKVKQTHKLNVCELAASNALDVMADMGNIMEDSSQEKHFNVEGLRTQSDKLREKVWDAWKEHPIIFLLRS